MRSLVDIPPTEIWHIRWFMISIAFLGAERLLFRLRFVRGRGYELELNCSSTNVDGAVLNRFSEKGVRRGIDVRDRSLITPRP